MNRLTYLLTEGVLAARIVRTLSDDLDPLFCTRCDPRSVLYWITRDISWFVKVKSIILSTVNPHTHAEPKLAAISGLLVGLGGLEATDTRMESQEAL